MATSKGQEMLGKAMKSKARTKKRGLVSDVVGAYQGATKAIQNAGTNIKNNIGARLADDAAITKANGGISKLLSSNPLALSNAKRKRAKRKAK